MRSKRRLFSGLVTLGLMLGITGTVAVPAALACGGFFCAQVPVDQAGERILFVQNGDEVTAHVQVQYQGEAQKFSWVVPTPSLPTLGVGSDALFTTLRTATRPTFNLTIETEGNCPQPVFAPTAGAVTNNGGGMVREDSGVNVISRAEVGPYDSVVLQANDPGALKSWLRENEYDIPATLDPLLDPYVAGKYYFVALKLQKDRSTGDLQPIVLKYKSTKPGIPIRLTGIAATSDMDVYVWVLGKERAIPENYRHAQINEARIDWLNAGTNYRQVVTEAMNEAGGQAFVTDYAGESKVVPTDAFSGKSFNLANLALQTDPVDFARALVQGGYFTTNSPIADGGGDRINVSTQQEINFLKRYVPKPAKYESVDDFQFYATLSQSKADLAPVDAAKAASELDQTVVKPYQEIRTMFEQHPYLTQLYTTLSPDEMTQDPTFLFNGQLPKVANVHTATGVRDCSQTQDFFNAPVKITLQNGVSFFATRATGGTGTGTGGTTGGQTPVAMPAALRIEQLKAQGPASLIQDNTATISKALGTVEARGEAIAVSSGATGATGAAGSSTTVSVPRSPRTTAPVNSGFGCACAPANQPAPPLTQGAGEGLAYALTVLGFLGYRRWAGRKKS